MVPNKFAIKNLTPSITPTNVAATMMIYVLLARGHCGSSTTHSSHHSPTIILADSTPIPIRQNDT